MERTRQEKLELIFTLVPANPKTTIITEKPQIEVGERRHGALKAIDALETILDVLRRLKLDEKIQGHGSSLQLKKLLTSVRNTDRLSQIETSTLIFKYGAVADAEHCYVEVREKVPNAAIDWEQWVEPFIVSPHFVQAWVADVEYDKWQNAQDPLIYKAANRDYSSLPMRSNGLPPPLEQMVVDISQNPGRWEFRSGYIEAIAAVMWLSELFWRYVGVDHRKRLAGLSEAKIKQETDDVVRISISETSFIDDSTRDLQERLRKILYG
ncbi:MULTISPECIES: hypothetical protein [Rhizobium]|uniref:hypothetical protein n=1 Tax=Rhizobium TaxID=379 RepID=UPI0007B53079|nr:MULTISPECIES: hypothetical protein [Rhizobium]KZS50838.1 hypothetical protein AS890_25890 [Rhizobium anhuiense bv. trifolii]MBB4251636.1 hypothetical protein [Rhizobium sp. BK008]